MLAYIPMDMLVIKLSTEDLIRVYYTFNFSLYTFLYTHIHTTHTHAYSYTHTHTHTHAHANTICTHCIDSHTLDYVLGRLQISSVQKVPSLSIVINCGTTGLPPTRVVWTKGRRQLLNNEAYQLSQFLRDRTTSAYNNLLTLNQTLQQSRGIYLCTVVNRQSGPTQSRFGPTETRGKE